jgi:electron transfer flavoprotein beta subunit
MYRGADKGYLLTDRKFAGSDTLATSYALSMAIRKMEPYSLVIAGRQAIDGDTAQVGPQVAEKLGLPQVTYVEEIQKISGNEIIIKRRLERGVEIVKSTLPLVITVHNTAPDCRPRNAKMLMKFKHARTVTEMQDSSEDYISLQQDRPYLRIEEWSVDDVKADDTMLGLTGSPTKVKKIENVVFKAKESKVLSGDNGDVEWLVKELIANSTIG